MPRYSARKIRRLLADVDAAPNTDVKGDKLESLVSYVFTTIPGVDVLERNALDAPRAHEIDVALWVKQAESNLTFCDPVTFVECKATAAPIGSNGVGWFVRKLQDRGATLGVLVSLSGITGGGDGVSNAYSEVLNALVRDRIKVLLLSRDELLSLRSTDDVVAILRVKFSELVLRRSVR